MQKIYLSFLLICIMNISFSQLTYTLSFTDSSKKEVQVDIILGEPVSDTLQFIMPRCVPGSYSALNFHHYIKNMIAISSQDSIIPMHQGEDDMPRWSLPQKQHRIKQISYTVDVGAMESELPDLGNASYIRSKFAGILNYAVFGWINGWETQPVILQVRTFTGWPIFSTIVPKEKMATGRETIACQNYYELSDGQTMMGPGLRVKEYQSLQPVFVAEYCETKKQVIDNFGYEAVASLGLLQDYFGFIPFTHYSVVHWAFVPARPRNETSLAMEHLNSATFIGDTSRLSLEKDTGDIRKHIFGILHHMGHAYIPLRCYGDAYRPYVTEIPLLIKNIWFNEGFIWFVCKDILKQKWIDNFLSAGVSEEIPALKELDLTMLSQLASLQYGDDFRIGIATFSRGAMMADEMNEYIIKQSKGKNSMRDVLRYLISWSQKNQRAFTPEEFLNLINASTGVDISDIYNKWQKALP
jgi:predicted metalloprotease with PDZ domain